MFAFIAAVLQAGSTILDKTFFNHSHKGYQSYIIISFPLVAIFSGIALVLFDIDIDASQLAGETIGWLLLSVCVILGSNILYYRAMAVDAVHEVQLIGLLNKLPTILLTSLLFSGERHIATILAALVAVLVVFWSHFDHHQFKLKLATRQFLFYEMLVSPFAVIAAKVLLETLHPIVFEFLRTLALALLVAPFFWSHIKAIELRSMLTLLVTNIITTIAWILYAFSIQTYGILYSILIFSLQPLLVYVASLALLKERFEWKKAVALIVVLFAIATNELLK